METFQNTEMNSDYEHWAKITQTLEEGGITDPDKYPEVWEEVYFACHVFWESCDHGLLQQMLNNNQWLLDEANRNIIETEAALDECPFRPLPERNELQEIEGEFNLGYVNYDSGQTGLNPLDFTRGLFICGETGSGKSYPVLRLICQILSIPKKVRAEGERRVIE